MEREDTEPYGLTDQDRALFEEICFLYRHAVELIEADQSHAWESMQRRRFELLEQLKAAKLDERQPEAELIQWCNTIRQAEAEFVAALKARLERLRQIISQADDATEQGP